MSTATREKPASGTVGIHHIGIHHLGIHHIRNGDENLKFAIVLVGIVVIATVAYVSLAAGWPKFSRAEVFFAECVREMLQTDNLVTPLYHGTPFFDKPIWSYWTIACSFKLFGISHLAARVPSIAAALGTVIVTAVGTKKIFGARAGTLAAAVLASSFMFLSFSTLCMSDMTLVFFDTLTLSLLYAGTVFSAASRASSSTGSPLSKESATRSITNSNICFWLAALSAGFAFLTKGPVGVVLPGVAFVLYLSLARQWKSLRLKTHVLPCLSILLLSTVPWFFAAFRENGAGALGYFFIRENLQRFAGSTYDTHRPFWFMLTSLFGGFLPWSIFLPFALKHSVAQWKLGECDKGRAHLFLWIWIATVVLFFSFSRGKIDYYVLPVYPAAAALTGLYLSDIADKKTLAARVWAALPATLALLSGVAGFVALPRTGLGFHEWCLAPAALTLGGAGMFWCIKQQQFRKAYKLIFVTVCMTAVAIAVQLFPWISARQAVLAYMPAIKAADRQTVIGMHTSVNNWIDEVLFQTGREAMPVKDTAMAGHLLKSTRPALILIPGSEYASLPAEIRDTSHVIASRPVILRSLNPGYFFSNMNKLSKQRLLLVRNTAAVKIDGATATRSSAHP